MKTLFYAFSVVLLRLLSLLPLWFLYLFAHLVSFLLQTILPYRKNIINKNLQSSFPEKSASEIKKIRKDFYRYFARMIVESVKMFGMSLRSMEKRMKLKNPEYLQQLYDQRKTVVAIAAHYGNWEWLLGMRNSTEYYSMAIFKPLNNKYFNRKMIEMRSRYGTNIVSMRDIPRQMLRLRDENIPSISVFISDQSPVWEETQFWTDFLNQETAVYLGPEKLARKFNAAVVYFRVTLKGKGMYETEIVPVSENAAEEEEFMITRTHLKLLEDDIRNAPEYWLWSHRRWKLTERRKKEEALGKFRFDGAHKRKETQ